ncbi:MAG: hypothetical protein CSB49_00260 [Proteobacteria bacterium]|nr:MAG: hypothetical protein CSB49_00260 [Pseudomonadota bacterium]
MKLAVAAGLCVFLCAPAANADRKGAIALKKQGDLLLSRGDTALGVKTYKRALRADRRYAPVWGALAMHYLRARNYAAAESLLGQCVELLPNYAEGWYQLAYARRKRGKHDAAIAAYRRYAKLRPKSADPHYGIGLALEAKKRYSEAAKAFRRYVLLESSPKRRSWIDKALKHAVEAERLARRARDGQAQAKATKKASPPRHALVPLAVGRKTPKSTRPKPTPITAERKRAQSHKLRGDRHAEQRRYEAAADAYRKAITVDYTYTAAFNELGSMLFVLRRYNDAIKVFRTAIRDNPNYLLGWYNLAYALRKTRRNREAIAAYKKYAAQSPNDPDPHFGIALAHQALGEKGAAIASYNRYIGLETRATHKPWIAKASAAVRKLGGTPAKAGSSAKPVDGGAMLAAAGGVKGGAKSDSGAAKSDSGAAKSDSGGVKSDSGSGGVKSGSGSGGAKSDSGGVKVAPLPPDVLAKALGKAVGKAPRPPKLSAKERRRLARAEQKRKRAEARRKRAEARAARRELARLARAERKRKQAEARRKRAEARRKRAEERAAKRAQARAERKRKRAEARRKRAEARAAKRELVRLARAERKRRREAARSAKAGRSKATITAKADATKAAPAVVAAKVPMAKPTAEPLPDKPVAIAPPPKPMGSGGSAADKLRAQGDSLARVGKCAQALPLYRRALEADPFATAAYHGVAYCSHRLHRYDVGVRLLRMGLRDNPGYVAGYLHLARLCDTKGAHTAAIGSYRKYLRKRPKDTTARFELARALRHGGHKPQAISAYQDYLRRERRKDADRRRAAAYAELLALGGAVPLVAGAAVAGAAATVGKAGKPGKPGKPDPFASALSAAKGTAKPKRLSRAERRRLARARAAEDRRMRKEARLAKLRAKREALRQARAERRRKAKERREARKRARAERLRKRKEARRAKLQARREARRRRAERRREDQMLARLAKKGGKKRGKLSRRGRAPLASNTGLARRLSDDLDALGKRPVAPKVELFDQLKPAPDAARGLVAVADKQFAKRRYIVALGIYRQAARLDSDASEPLYKAGVAAVAVGRMHLAAELFERVLQIDPGNATARTSLRLARTAAKGNKPSAAFLSSALSRAKADIGAGRYARAARLLTKLERQVASAQIYRLRAAARLGLRQSRGAVRDAGRALALAPTEADALRLLGDAQRQLGKQRKALYYYRLFLTRTAGNAAASSARKAVQSAIAELSNTKV